MILIPFSQSAGCDFKWPEMEGLKPISDLRVVPNEIWQRKAIAYSGYREGQSPREEIYPSDEEVLEDLRLLIEAGFGLIRVYNSVGHGEQVIRLIAQEELDLRVQLGAYIKGSFAENPEYNTLEIKRTVELANQYPEIVMGVSVGNEILVSWSFVAVPPQEAIGYIQYVRKHISQPVTVNDNWEPYAADPESPIAQVWTQIDYASIHTYAYWEAGFENWEFLNLSDERIIQNAVEFSFNDFQKVRKALDAAGVKIPIVIGETGWQSVPSAREGNATYQEFAEALAGVERMKQYFEAMQNWAYGEDGDTPGDGFSRPSSMFYFAAFDEPWKEQDDNWGLWDADRKKKVE